MLRILTLWRTRQVFVDIEQTLRLIREGQNRKRVTDTGSLETGTDIEQTLRLINRVGNARG